MKHPSRRKITDKERINFMVAVGGGPYLDTQKTGWFYLPRDYRGLFTGPHKTWRMATDAAIKADRASRRQGESK